MFGYIKEISDRIDELEEDIKEYMVYCMSENKSKFSFTEEQAERIKSVKFLCELTAPMNIIIDRLISLSVDDIESLDVTSEIALTISDLSKIPVQFVIIRLCEIKKYPELYEICYNNHDAGKYLNNKIKRK